jgi:RND family efflux transporter MFP subunit
MNFSLQQSPGPGPAAAPAPTRDLPALQRPSRRGPGRGKAPLIAGALVLGTVGVVLTSVPGLGKSVSGLFASSASDIIPYRAVRQKLAVTVKERGNLESAKNEDVANEVEGQTTIIRILPEGTRVKKGDEVCVLDSATLRDNLTNQEITTKRAEADYQNALKTREVADIAVKEYLEGTYPQEAATIEGELTLAKSEFVRAKDRLKWTKEMVQKGYASESQKLADEQASLKAEISEKNAVDKMRVLKEYTSKREVTELRANVEKARSDELAKLATYDLEKKKEDKLRRQIEKCVLRAPNDGLVVYANETNNFRGNNQALIEEGATVRERQKIFSLPDITKMQVNTKVHESMVNMVVPGLRARIRVESNPEVLTGTVKSIAPLPDPSNFFASDVKVYTTIVTIDTQGLTSLRPGMTAEVEILIQELEDVLAIPLQAVLQFKGKEHVFVLTPEGPKLRSVKVGVTNDKLIEIKEGLKSGEQVAMNPSDLLTDDEKREAFDTTKADTKKDWGKAPPGTPTPALSPGLQGPAAGAGPGGPGGPGGAGGPAEKGKAKGKRGGGFNPALFQKFGTLPDDERAKLRDPSTSEEEREALMKKAGLTDAEIDQMKQMRRNFGGGGGRGGPGGPGGGGGGGGGFGGGPGGGGPPQ